MAISSISAASLSQYVLSSSNSTQLQQALQALQNSLASGDVNAAQSAFQTVQKLNQNLATASGTSASSSSQLTTDLTALGSALSSGDLSTAQSAFATVQNDLKNGNSPSQPNETDTASQSVQLVAELLSTLNVSSYSASDPDSATSMLNQVYGNRSTLNVSA
jgi:ribosomal protein S20